MSAFGTKLAYEFERRTAGFAVLKTVLIGQEWADTCHKQAALMYDRT
jgi:hypothetical protein